MATKQNMFVGLSKEIKEAVEKINECIIAKKIDGNGVTKIAIYDGITADRIKYEVSNCQGKLQMALKGLDRNSRKRNDYEEALNLIDDFMRLVKRESGGE